MKSLCLFYVLCMCKFLFPAQGEGHVLKVGQYLDIQKIKEVYKVYNEILWMYFLMVLGISLCISK
jgi:hypothetical protein